MPTWEIESNQLDKEIDGCEFGDKRLRSRLRELVRKFSRSVGGSIPLACQDWANTKAAYRFLSNAQVKEDKILAGHFEATGQRFEVASEPVLILHDTTEFIFKRSDIDSVGLITTLERGFTRKEPRSRRITLCGILMHSSLVVTASGLPLGLAAIKFWTRSHFKGTNALKRNVNPTRILIEKKESIRWIENIRNSTALLGEPSQCVHIGDRESDIYELFCAAEALGTNFLVRTYVDRLAVDGNTVVSKELLRQPVRGHHSFLLRDKEGKSRKVRLAIKYAPLCLHPPVNKRRRYSPLLLNVLEAHEQDAPKDAERIVWKLITNLPIESLPQAIEKLHWYAMRWKIETFHKILKSGCRAEESRLRTAQRLANLIAIYCIFSWRVFWVTMVNRTEPSADPSVAFTEQEIDILNRLAKVNKSSRAKKPSLTNSILQLARLGGCLARANDPPPGNLVIWRGMSRLADIQFGVGLERDTCG